MTPAKPEPDSLEPCPFCGGDAQINGGDDGRMFVECNDCAASSMSALPLKEDPRPMLIAAWNKRARLESLRGDDPLLDLSQALIDERDALKAEVESLRGAKGDIPVAPGVIADRCPSCGGRTLFVGSGGWITCSVIGCKEPCLEQWMESHRAAPPERHVREGEGMKPLCRR